MAGVYIHIPFCKTKCHYCDFYSVTKWDNDLQKQFLEALFTEIDLRKDWIDQQIDTVYFGGGTPSVFQPETLQKIFEKLQATFKISPSAEITAELNPDDVTPDFVQRLRDNTKINRISLGVQSFIDEDLKLLGRRHNTNQSEQAIRLLLDVGFSNISIDIIYGLPSMTEEKLLFNLNKFLLYKLPHLSAYHLTIEEGTVFYTWLKSGKIKELNEEQSIKLFDLLIDFLSEYHYFHYEISNFALEGYISKHNFSYWTGKKYFGFGPAAHGYDGNTRYWNTANIKQYILKLQNRLLPSSSEKLTDKDKFNEYILTRLRTYLGINTDFLRENYKNYFSEIQPIINRYIDDGFLKQNKQNIVLTRKGIKIADTIIADIFI